MTKAPKTKAPDAKPSATKPAAPAAAEKKAPAKKTAEKPAEKTAAAKPAATAAPKGKTIDTPKAGSKPNALQQKLQPSADLAAVVGGGTMARGEVVSKVWEYIKSHKLQNPDDGREILADDKLDKVFGKKKVTMFEMNKLLAQHLK